MEYEWIPPYRKCRCFGHVEKHCPTVEVWLPKDKSCLGEADTEEDNTVQTMQK